MPSDTAAEQGQAEIDQQEVESTAYQVVDDQGMASDAQRLTTYRLQLRRVEMMREDGVWGEA